MSKVWIHSGTSEREKITALIICILRNKSTVLSLYPEVGRKLVVASFAKQ
jgi:hypothetical protein